MMISVSVHYNRGVHLNQYIPLHGVSALGFGVQALLLKLSDHKYNEEPDEISPTSVVFVVVLFFTIVNVSTGFPPEGVHARKV